MSLMCPAPTRVTKMAPRNKKILTAEAVELHRRFAMLHGDDDNVVHDWTTVRGANGKQPSQQSEDGDDGRANRSIGAFQQEIGGKYPEPSLRRVSDVTPHEIKVSRDGDTNIEAVTNTYGSDVKDIVRRARNHSQGRNINGEGVSNINTERRRHTSADGKNTIKPVREVSPDNAIVRPVRKTSYPNSTNTPRKKSSEVSDVVRPVIDMPSAGEVLEAGRNTLSEVETIGVIEPRRKSSDEKNKEMLEFKVPSEVDIIRPRRKIATGVQPNENIEPIRNSVEAKIYIKPAREKYSDTVKPRLVISDAEKCTNAPGGNIYAGGEANIKPFKKMSGDLFTDDDAALDYQKMSPRRLIAMEANTKSSDDAKEVDRRLAMLNAKSDGGYDWDAMISNRGAENLSQLGKDAVAPPPRQRTASGSGCEKADQKEDMSNRKAEPARVSILPSRTKAPEAQNKKSFDAKEELLKFKKMQGKHVKAVHDWESLKAHRRKPPPMLSRANPKLYHNHEFYVAAVHLDEHGNDIQKCDTNEADDEVVSLTLFSDLFRKIEDSVFTPPYVPKNSRSFHLWEDAAERRAATRLTDEQIREFALQYNFTENQILEMEEAFQVFDIDANGVITVNELGTVMMALGQRPSLKELEALIQGVDTDNSGTVDFGEFLSMMGKQLLMDPEQELREIFSVFDCDGDGVISCDELYGVLSKLDHTITREEVTGMIAEADVNGDGVVDFSEFKGILHAK